MSRSSTPSLRRRRVGLLCLAASLAGLVSAFATPSPAGAQAPAPTVISGAGDLTAATTARDQFRAAVGGGTTAGANGSFGGVRREINWDGVPDARADPNNLPLDFFNVNSPRGAIFSTPGTAVQVSANPTTTVLPEDFGTIDASYATTFDAFSQERLFTAIGSNVVDVTFFVPGSTRPATTSAFGVVFVDVDRAGSTSMVAYDTAGRLITTASPAAQGFGGPGFSFVGIVSPTPIHRIRITSGDAALAPGTVETASVDLVTMDDFLYAEPRGLGYVPLEPSRLLETRTEYGQVGYTGAKPTANQVIELQVTGRGNVPATGVAAVALNITATDATAPGFVTVWACGTTRPNASNLNLEQAGQTIPNLVITGMSSNGRVCISTQSGAHLIADVQGWFATGSGYTPLEPARLLETRTEFGQVGYTGAKPTANQVIQLQVTGRGNVPTTGVGAVALNITATDATGAGFVTVWPCGTTRPNASNLNLERVGQTIPNLVISGLDSSGRVCISTQSGAHLIADVQGWFATGSGYTPLEPARLLETRTEFGQVGYTGAKPTANQVIQLQVTGRGNVPTTGVGAVALNITATDATGAGFVTVWPCGTTRPNASNLNLERVGQTIPNLVISGLDSSGRVRLSTQSGAHLIADVQGWFAS